MIRKDIIQMAKESGLAGLSAEHLERFAKRVAAAEREACAKVADEAVNYWVKDGFPDCAEVREAMHISEQIMARGEQ